MTFVRLLGLCKPQVISDAGTGPLPSNSAKCIDDVGKVLSAISSLEYPWINESCYNASHDGDLCRFLPATVSSEATQSASPGW